jgi:hypothetical protein
VKQDAGLLQSAIVVGLLCAVGAFGSIALQLQASDKLNQYGDRKMEQLESRASAKESKVYAAFRKRTQEQRALAASYAPAQLGTLAVYGLCVVLVVGCALRAQGSREARRWLGIAAAAALGMRLLVGLVEWRYAIEVAPYLKDTVSLSASAGAHGAPLPPAAHKMLGVYAAIAGGEMLLSPLAWTLALCSYFGWVAVVFLRKDATEAAP